jgi:uncharacterized membrane protein YgcG
MRRILVFAVLLGWGALFGAVGPVGAVGAAERVLEFDSDIQIHADGSLTVRERIKVQAEGRVIKRGIFRDFPTDYRDRYGAHVRVPFDVLEVTRDGRPEPYVIQRQRNGVRVRIGSANVYLKHGTYSYEIRYRTARQLGFFDDHDELYWNVNGNGWVFAMDRVAAEVKLPRAVPAAELKLDAFSGRQGARGRDFDAEAFDGGARFETNRMLRPHEGLTIVVAFPKGIVAEPSWRARVGWWLDENRGAAAGFGGFVLLLIFLYWRWTLVGRDPRAGPRFPRYAPPPGLGPAGVRYVDRMAADDRCFAAALLGLAERGYLHIDRTTGEERYEQIAAGLRSAAQAMGSVAEGLLDMVEEPLKAAARRQTDYAITRTGQAMEWLPGEAQLARTLLPGESKEIVIGRQHNPTVQMARDALHLDLKLQLGGRYFSRNLGSFAIGVVIAIVSFVAMIMLEAPILFIAVVALSMVAVLVLFSRWLPAYSVQGRKLKDAIDGLRQYLSVAEADDLRRMKAPPQTAEEFARLLPYAFALDVETTWADRFAATLGVAAVAAAMNSHYGGGVGGFADGRRASDLAGSLSDLGSTISAASTPPGSSSGGSGGGGGGGGGSGGGGGGGGGGGW